MFYLDDKYYTYPSKSVIEDVITREGPADENSFTPYDGCRHVIQQQFPRDSASRFNLEEFLLYTSSQDFDPRRVKRDVEDVSEDEIGGTSKRVNAGFTTIESVDSQSYVEEYVINQIIGYKTNRDSPYRQNEVRDVEYLKDEESGDMISPAELVTKKENIDLDYYIEIQKKFPYLLKMLHTGSIYYGIHLLSFMRAYECVKDNKKWTPADFGAQGVYKMERNGKIGRKFIHTEDNKIPTYYPFGRQWAVGDNPNDAYYKAAQEFLAICNFLGVDIKKENPLDYDKEYIDSIVCTYIASNEEYIESYGYADPAIIDALSPENIFRQRKLSNASSEEESTKKSLNTMAELINLNLEVFKLSNTGLCSKEDIYHVNELFEVVSSKTNSVRYRVDDFTLQDNLFMSRAGNYVTLNCTRLGTWDYEIGKDGKYVNMTKRAVITFSGLLILLEEVDDCIHYISCEEAIKIYRGEANARRWSTLRL